MSVSARSRNVILLLALAPGCAGTMDRGTSAAPMSNVYLRNSFDTDPSIYLGRFVPRTATDLDEGTAMPLTCSQHVKYRFIDGGGVKVTEHMNVSSEIAARIGIPVVASANASASKHHEVKVEYTLTGKMVAEITDPAAFEECCESKPDQCTDRFIGEFLQGTGAVYREDSTAAQVSGQGTNPTNGVSGSGEASREKSYTQAIEFPNPVYFAFKVTQTPNNRTTSSCGPWVDAPPTEEGYVFFVGSSRAAKNERNARVYAQYRAMAEAYNSASKPVGIPEEGADPSTNMQDPAAAQWAKGMQIVESCVEVEQTGKGPRYVGRVLGKLPRYTGSTSTPSPSPTPSPTVETPDIEMPTTPEPE
jgi:hypothetical protein